MVVDQAYAACERAVQVHYENFPVASFLLPRQMRPHVAAVYAFARAADDFADEGDLPASERLRLIDGWEERLHAAAESALAMNVDIPKNPFPVRNRCMGGSAGLIEPLLQFLCSDRPSPTTTNPDDTNVSGDCQAAEPTVR